MSQNNISKLREFVVSFAKLLDTKPDEAEVLRAGSALLHELVKEDDWLPEEYSKPHPQYYQQYLLHVDSLERFSIVSFVWGPSQITPIHNHTVWGLIGMLRGEELSQNFVTGENGILIPDGEPIKLSPGTVEAVSPTVGDLHQVRNAFDDKTSISIHVYGANIGAVNRSVFYEDGTSKPFISGYTNTFLPNIWDRSKELKTA